MRRLFLPLLVMLGGAQTASAAVTRLYYQDFTQPLGREWVDAALPRPNVLDSISPAYFGYGEAVACAKSWGCDGTVQIDKAHGYALFTTRRITQGDRDKIAAAQNASMRPLSGSNVVRIAKSKWVGTWRQLNIPIGINTSIRVRAAPGDDIASAGGFWLYSGTADPAVNASRGEYDLGECSGLGKGKFMARFNVHYQGELPSGWTPPKGTTVARKSTGWFQRWFSNTGWISIQTNIPVPKGMHEFGVDRTAKNIIFYLDGKPVVRYPMIPELAHPLSLILMQTIGYKQPTTSQTLPQTMAVKDVTINQFR